MPVGTARAPIATLTITEQNGRLALHSEFASGHRLGRIILGDSCTIKSACQKAGKYLASFAEMASVTRPGEPEKNLEPFRFLLNSGNQIALLLCNQNTDELRRLKDAFEHSWPSWRRMSRREIPSVQLVADTEAATSFPLELIPIFGSGEIPSPVNAAVLQEVAGRFLGFTAVVHRVQWNTSRNPEELDNDPNLPVQFVRYLDKPRLLRKSGSGFKDEVAFFASLRDRGRVSLDGPWPTSSIPKNKVANALIDSLYYPECALDPSAEPGRLAQVTHFACHCHTGNRTDDADYELELSTEQGHPRSVKLGEMRTGYIDRADRTQQRHRRTRAPVILNACGSSSVDPWTALSFHKWFLANGHRAFVGTQTDIYDDVAAWYVNYLYRFLLGGFTLGEAVVMARRQLLVDKSCPLGVLYIQYGNDQLRVKKPYVDELPEDIGA
ncbi:CHAT domain-containing protein [Frankia sp. CiP3]|uniref:CHAT domain-containing protein n=1 Tax=Frankia sp. CiP3 TaxID=2880971 RepID=UPI001EF68595|nr:CHAT domain-containing protein [Frankia sp. CiP3]